jgi:hypothetical protein
MENNLNIVYAIGQPCRGFGHMNGMRPMGMIVFEGRRNGDVLEGDHQFRGIVLPLPDGHMGGAPRRSASTRSLERRRGPR